MRRLVLTFAAACVGLTASTGIPEPAHAIHTYSLVWSGTTGSGTVGSDVIAAAPGDTLTLDVLIHIDEFGTQGAAYDLHGTNVTAVSGEECPPGSSSGSSTNPQAGICATDWPLVFFPADPGVTVQGADVLGYDALTLGVYVFGTLPVLVGRGVFVANGIGEVALWDPTCGGAPVCTAEHLPNAVATIVPEPGTLGLLALGLGTIARMHRPRSRRPAPARRVG